MPVTSSTSTRLTSLDQFRGYTIFGMLLVNFLGHYDVCPRLLKHSHDYCSYADTIMPQFLFAVGFAMRLSLVKGLEVHGQIRWVRAIRRILGLAAVAIVWYSINDIADILRDFHAKSLDEFLLILFKRGYFQTLMHIAATSLWILPVISGSSRVRLTYALVSGVLHLVLSWWFNFVWVNSDPKGIDGGPLGFLTWTIPALAGTLAFDAVRASAAHATSRIAVSGIAVMLLGWLMSNGSVLYDVTQDDVGSATTIDARAPMASSTNDRLAYDPVIPSRERWVRWNGKTVEPPFVRPPDAQHRKWNYWMMSQRSGTSSYQVFAAGWSLVVFALIYRVCENKSRGLGLFRTLGTNSLSAYLFHDIAFIFVLLAIPEKTASIAVVLTGFGCFVLLVYALCRVLERFGWYIRV